MSRPGRSFLFPSCPLEEEMGVRLNGVSVHKLARTIVATALESCTLWEAAHHLVAGHRCPRGHWHPNGELWCVKSLVGADVNPQLCCRWKPWNSVSVRYGLALEKQIESFSFFPPPIWCGVKAHTSLWLGHWKVSLVLILMLVENEFIIIWASTPYHFAVILNHSGISHCRPQQWNLYIYIYRFNIPLQGMWNALKLEMFWVPSW